jgi:hypothetical protein
MKTAIEWLEDNIDREMLYREILMVIKQAKEMEKEQIIDFAYEIADELAYDVYSKKVIEDKFKKTFKSE